MQQQDEDEAKVSTGGHHAPVAELGLLQKAAFQVVAGGSGGFVEVCLMQPLDVVKTRMQLQVSAATSQVRYNGVFDCFRQMYRSEGALSFWKGILPPILAETPKRAIKFLCYEQMKPLLLFGASAPTPMTYTLAGLSAGIFEAVVVNPFEVVKVTQQADRTRMKEAQSTMTVTKKIIREGGLGSRGLNKGVTATMGRNGAFNMVYFGLYNTAKDLTPTLQDPLHEFLRKSLLAFMSGTSACFLNIPFDVAKSRIQGPQPEAGVIKYRSTVQTLNLVYKEEGFRALYKGLVPKVMRLGPGGAIMMLVYEHVFKFLESNYA